MNTVNAVSIVRLRALIDAGVDHVGRELRALALDLAKPVEGDDRVVERVADDREQRGDDRQIDLERIDLQRRRQAWHGVRRCTC